METIYIFVAFAIMALGLLLFAAIFKKGSHQSAEQGYPYALKQFFFTKSEQIFFSMLTEQLPSNQYRVFPKVRMGDYIEPTNLGAEWRASWNRIKSRHVDFLVWEKASSRFVLAIELDGKSHNNGNAQKTDSFKDGVFKAVGLPLYRVKVGSNFIAEIEAIKQQLTSSQN